MSTLLKTSLLGLAMVSTAAMAELSDFTGFEAGAKLSVNNGKASSGSLSTNGNNSTFGLHGGYGLELSKDSLVLFGIDYDTGNVSAGSLNNNNGVSMPLDFKNPYGLSVGYGLLVKDDTLAYAKISYEAATFSYDNFEANMHGFGLGAGVRYLLNKTTYLQAELKYAKYTNSSDGNIDSDIRNTQLNIGVGMRF